MKIDLDEKETSWLENALCFLAGFVSCLILFGLLAATSP